MAIRARGLLGFSFLEFEGARMTIQDCIEYHPTLDTSPEFWEYVFRTSDYRMFDGLPECRLWSMDRTIRWSDFEECYCSSQIHEIFRQFVCHRSAAHEAQKFHYGRSRVSSCEFCPVDIKGEALQTWSSTVATAPMPSFDIVFRKSEHRPSAKQVEKKKRKVIID